MTHLSGNYILFIIITQPSFPQVFKSERIIPTIGNLRVNIIYTDVYLLNIYIQNEFMVRDRR